MTNQLRFRVEKAARPYIRDAWLDIDRYRCYLENRNVPEAEYEALDVIIDNTEIFCADGTYQSRDYKDPQSRHQITLAPYRVLGGEKRRGKMLRHESEHFVYRTRHPNTLRNRAIIIAGVTAIAAATAAATVGEGVYESLADMPPVVDWGGASISAMIAAGLGAFASFATSATAHMAYGPSELQAQWAEHRFKSALPDDVLQIEAL